MKYPFLWESRGSEHEPLYAPETNTYTNLALEVIYPSLAGIRRAPRSLASSLEVCNSAPHYAAGSTTRCYYPSANCGSIPVCG